MRILYDADVIMDFILKRGSFSDDAEKIIAFCSKENIESCIASHTVPNLHYILRKHLTKEQRDDILLELCRMFVIVAVDAEKIISALQNKNFADFEDCLQVECAKSFKADYIITRNTKDFRESDVPVIRPSEFIKRFLGGD